MDKVYECDISKKNELKKILDEDPYSEDSISRIGYILKDGSTLGEDDKKVYVYISAPEEKVAIVSKKIGSITSEVKGDVADRIVSKIKDEQNKATEGFGNIFG